MFHNHSMWAVLVAVLFGAFVGGCPASDEDENKTEPTDTNDDYNYDDTDTNDDYEYDDYLYDDTASGLTGSYKVVLSEATSSAEAATSVVVNVARNTLRSSTVTEGARLVWNESLGHGRAHKLAQPWTISVISGGQAVGSCTVPVTEPMITRWGGLMIATCGPLSNLAVHFVPAN